MGKCTFACQGVVPLHSALQAGRSMTTLLEQDPTLAALPDLAAAAAAFDSAPSPAGGPL